MFEGVCPVIRFRKHSFPQGTAGRAAKEPPQDADKRQRRRNGGAGSPQGERIMSDMSVSSAMNSTAREYLQVAVQKKAQDAEAQAALSLLAGAMAQMDTVSAAAQAPQPAAAPAEGSAVDIRV